MIESNDKRSGKAVLAARDNDDDDDDDDDDDVYIHIYQPFRSGRIWHKVSF